MTNPTTAPDGWEQAQAALAKAAAQRRGALRQLRSAADIVQVVGWLAGAAGIIAGLLVALTREESAGFLTDDTYPNIGAGIGIAASSIVAGAVIVLLGLWAEAWSRVNDGP